MVNDAKTTTIKRFLEPGELIAGETPSGVDSALEALNGALAALGNLRVRPDDAPVSDADVFTAEDARQSIECQYISTLCLRQFC
jgi:hypothetical protein